MTQTTNPGAYGYAMTHERGRALYPLRSMTSAAGVQRWDTTQPEYLNHHAQRVRTPLCAGIAQA